MDLDTAARVCFYDGRLVYVVDHGRRGFKDPRTLAAYTYNSGTREFERVKDCLTADLDVHTIASRPLRELIGVWERGHRCVRFF
jgi:hypothetical protein